MRIFSRKTHSTRKVSRAEALRIGRMQINKALALASVCDGAGKTMMAADHRRVAEGLLKLLDMAKGARDA